MQTGHSTQSRIRIAAAFAVFSVMAGVGLGRIEPAGRKASLVQFDAVTQLNMEMEWENTNTVVFARYWVCRDFYAIAVAWCEPRGNGLLSIFKTVVILSDRASFRIADELHADYRPLNTTYPKPLGERPPFPPKNGINRLAEMRFTEAESMARRVYLSDLTAMTNPGRQVGTAVELKVPEVADGVKRKLARLKVNADGERIRSMELLDHWQEPLCKVSYEYEGAGNASALAKLIAELPAGIVKRAMDANTPITYESGGKLAHRIYKVTDVDQVYHRGGRTCTVTYKDVALADQRLRLPVQVEVRNTEDKRLMRSTRLTNFKHVDLDKAGVWEAAKAFAGISREEQACQRLVDKYLYPEPNLGPMRVDPNDLAFVRRLIAKYPVPETPRPKRPSPEIRIGTASPKERMMLKRQEAEAAWRETERLAKEQSKLPRLNIEPNDLRAIRQLCAYYREKIFLPLTPEQKAEGGFSLLTPVKGTEEIRELRAKLYAILSHHHVPTLPQDLPPRMDPNDLALIHRLQGHFEALVMRVDGNLAGRLKAIDTLTRLDIILKDYNAYETHTARYLQMLDDGGLMAMYMVGGVSHLGVLVGAGQYDKANRLMRQWADKSAAGNDPDAVYRFVGLDAHGQANLWAGVQVLDRFLRKPGLSPMERYEGLALRAISLDKLDKMLADPKADEDELRHAQAQWIFKTTTRAQIAGMVEPAVRQAVSAWGALGTARLTDAKPYSTAHGYSAGGIVGATGPDALDQMLAKKKEMTDIPEATRLQETSAQLNQIVNERKIQMEAPARPRETQRPAPRGRRGG
jgi:hypothetical protein